MAARLQVLTRFSVILAVFGGDFLPDRAYAQHPGESATVAAKQGLHADAAQSGESQAIPEVITPLQKLKLIRWASMITRRRVPLGIVPPRLTPTPAGELAAMVCPDRPDRCRTMAATYSLETGIIHYRESFDMRRVVDRSYLVHELVHWLQHVDQGAEATRTCEMIVRNEREAYEVQAVYLRRHGSALANQLIPRSMTCKPEPQLEDDLLPA